MFSGSRMNDDGLTAARRFNLPHAESHSLESSPDLGCAEIDVEPIAFDVGHLRHESKLDRMVRGLSLPFYRRQSTTLCSW
jgi:hypothetical protein